MLLCFFELYQLMPSKRTGRYQETVQYNKKNWSRHTVTRFHFVQTPHELQKLKKLCSEQEQARAYLRPAGECKGHDRYLETCTGLSGVHHPRRCRHLAPFSLQQLCDTLFAERLIHAECSVDTAPIEQS